jgi:hypothetical protein
VEAVRSVRSAAPLPIDRARDAKYRNIAAGQGKAPTLNCRAFFHESKYNFSKKKVMKYLFHFMKE